jgi:hypothetical protein
MKVTTLILTAAILLPTSAYAQSTYERPYRTVPVSPGYSYYQMKDGTVYPGYHNYYNSDKNAKGTKGYQRHRNNFKTK